MLTREFNIDIVLVLWDAIFAFDAEFTNKGKCSSQYDNKDYGKELNGPLCLLDYLVVAMIEYLKKDCTYMNSIIN